MKSTRRLGRACIASTLILAAVVDGDHGSDNIVYNANVNATGVLERRLFDVFGPKSVSRKRRNMRKLPPRLPMERILEEAAYDDLYTDDTTDDANANNDDVNSGFNEQCTNYLLSFLEGTTDAHDTCEGIMNAYTAAECSLTDTTYAADYDYDDYFKEFTEHNCCQALTSHYSAHCEESTMLSNLHLFIVASVLLLCEIAKAVVNKFNIHFLPEAGVCIFVGIICGSLGQMWSKISNLGGDIDEMSFDGELFMSVLLPPIIFEAALSVSKYEFKRRRGAILMFSVFGTIISTFTSGFMVHYMSKLFASQTFPMLDSLVFGALISSIDPVAILSVLTSLNLDQKDTIFILVFGESLLNDGIAITLFKTLVDRFDGRTNDESTSVDEVLGAIANFLIAMVGSIFVGLACGGGAWIYFYYLDHKLPATMEVGSFFLWALLPYYICDGVGWSGIVSIVVIGFFMDIYIAGPKDLHKQGAVSNHSSMSTPEYMGSPMSGPLPLSPAPLGGVDKGRNRSFDSELHSVRPLPGTEKMHLSFAADKHVRFVAHLTSQLAENAIFAYLGLFLFSEKYVWDPILISISIFSCVVSRAFMIILVSFVLCRIYEWRGQAPTPSSDSSTSTTITQHIEILDANGMVIQNTNVRMSRTAAAIQDKRTQAVLVLAGLRGAVSFALVENVPIYNNVTGEGCEFKQLMKGMTSASIIFTTFLFGGGAYYILPHLGISPDNTGKNDAIRSNLPMNVVSPTRYNSFRTPTPGGQSTTGAFV